MTLTNIFGHWINLDKVISVQDTDYGYPKHIIFDNNFILEVKNVSVDDIVNEINRKSVQKDDATDDFKFELRPISKIETVTDYDEDESVLVKYSHTYGCFSFGFVKREYKNNMEDWTHFALLP